MVSWTRLYVTWYVHCLSGEILLPKGRSGLGLYNSYRGCFQGVKWPGRSVYHPPRSIAEAETGKGHTGITTTPGVPTLPWYAATFTLLSHNSLPERAKAQAVSRRILTAEVCVRCQNRPCEESVDEVAVRVFNEYFRVPLPWSLLHCSISTITLTLLLRG
jgi:hypothetical protein